MKIRSYALFNYLVEADVLNGTPEQIAAAKISYRKLYKRNWKLRIRPVKEIRFTVTLKQYKEIQIHADCCAIKPITYAKHTVLESIGAPIMTNAVLLDVLQLVSMATIGAIKQNRSYTELSALLQQAEQLLVRHIQNMHT